MTELESSLFTVVLISNFIALILYVLFGQVTVRKLRKNLVTKELLGFGFISGWDILNVAQALAIPRGWAQKLKNSPLSSLFADADLLNKHTHKVDKILAFVLYWLLIFTFSGWIFLLLSEGMRRF